jgi:hypothetical protein
MYFVLLINLLIPVLSWYGTLQFGPGPRSEAADGTMVRSSLSDARAYYFPYLLQSMFEASAQIDGRLRYEASVKSSEIKCRSFDTPKNSLNGSIFQRVFSTSLNLCPDRRDIFCNQIQTP